MRARTRTDPESWEAIDEHVAIYQAIRDGDPEAAARAAAIHLDNTLEDYRREIQRRVFGDDIPGPQAAGRAVKQMAIASLVCWAGVITSGRLLAYTYHRLMQGFGVA